jgi:hypothetical protein
LILFDLIEERTVLNREKRKRSRERRGEEERKWKEVGNEGTRERAVEGGALLEIRGV